MTTTAHEDQFTIGTQTIEPVRQPYNTVSILRRNIADMEVALRTQTERAEVAEVELEAVREDNHSMMLEIHNLRIELEQKPVAWRPVVGFEGLYEVSSEGDIRNAQTGNIAAKHLMGDGYVKADLWKKGKRKQTSAHRVVAEAFIGPIDGLEINHRNGVKTDNRVANLEITTRSENVNHSYYELGNIIKPIVATNTTSGQSTEYRSIEEAVREGGFRSSSIYDCLNGKVKTHSGHSFSRPAAPVPANQPQSGVLAVPAEWRDAVGAALGLLENTTCESGVCMCGDSVIGHADFSVGHSACDSGTYHQLGVIEQLRALLQSAEVHPDDNWQLTPAPTHPADRDAREVRHD